MTTTHRWKTIAATGLAATVLAASTGCAKWRNEVARDGSLIGSTNGDYIILNYNGGQIMDCWKLRDVHVQSETASDGWLFRDERGNVINISGAQKVMRVKDSGTFDKYCEYHREFDARSYSETCVKR